MRIRGVTALALAAMVFIGVAMVHESAHTRAQSTHTHAQTGVAASSMVRMETLLQSDTSWDGAFYQAYPEGQPELTVVKLTVPPHTALPWHSHPMPNAAYVVSGQIQVQRQVDGLTLNMGAGQVLAEMVDTPHRGVTGDEPAVLIVFYAGSPGLPLSDIVQ